MQLPQGFNIRTSPMPRLEPSWVAPSKRCFWLPNFGVWDAIASSSAVTPMWPTLRKMPMMEGHMNEYTVPSQEDLNAYIVLIRFLRQVHSNMQCINDEAERFNKLLEEQCEVLDRHRSDIKDLTSALSDYEDEIKRVKSIDPLDQQHNQ